jgi:hypothetical protein
LGERFAPSLRERRWFLDCRASLRMRMHTIVSLAHVIVSLADDASSLAHELFVPEFFAQDNLAEHLTRSELHRSISHLGDLERLHCFLDKVR